MRTCKTCTYYHDINSWGYCKFNAPFIRKEQRYKYNSEGHSELIEDICHKEWVKVSDYEWCGQFRHKENPFRRFLDGFRRSVNKGR